MITEKEKRQIAIMEGVSPNFQLISKYYSELNEERFYHHYNYYKLKIDLKSIDKLLSKRKLNIYRSEILYFLIENTESLEFNIWAKEVNLSNVHERARVEKEKLRLFLDSINSPSKFLSHKELQKLPAIKEIVFKTDKQPQLKLKSYKLCYELIEIIEKFLIVNETSKTKSKRTVNTNPRQYERNFIIGLIPFLNYLENETIIWGSKNSIYAFICSIIDYLPFEISISPDRIKDTLKAH